MQNFLMLLYILHLNLYHILVLNQIIHLDKTIIIYYYIILQHYLILILQFNLDLNLSNQQLLKIIFIHINLIF